MFVPLMLAPIYTSALLFGPAFVIVLAVCVALLVRFPSIKSWMGAAMIAVGFVEMSLVPVWVFWVFFIGFTTSVIGIAALVNAMLSGRQGVIADKIAQWTASRSGGNTVCFLKKSLYVLLAVGILSSVVVLSLRTTHVLREELYDNWTLTTTASTTVRGVVTGIYLNHEVNMYGYSYHIFPALIIMNVTEVVKVGESWMNLTEQSAHWVNENMTIGYDKPNVPSLAIGQRVEASGYYDAPVEDSWSYSFKLVVSAKIDGSYVESLQG